MKYTIYRHKNDFVMWETDQHWERVYTPIIRTDSEKFGIAALTDLRKRMDKEEEKEYYAKYMH